ncbi:MAG: DUF5317 domain-containing protein [Anaerolineae bacterium]|nr:DUF5317 domain-containing protein [Anaerolineae bacterium]
MVLVDAVIILIVLALLFRRDLSTIGRFRFCGGWKLAVVVPGLFVLQAILIIFAPRQTILQILLLILSQFALILLLLLNRHVPGAKLFAVGVFLNTTVMIANGGWMPLTPEMYQFVHPEREIEIYDKPSGSKSIILPREETRGWVLTDIIPVSLPWRRNVVSIGDTFLILGVAQLIFLGTKKKEGKMVKLKGISP